MTELIFLYFFKYQVTHYGLGGLCETHIDPYGYIGKKNALKRSNQFIEYKLLSLFNYFFSFLIIEGAGLYDFPPVQRLKLTGDIFGTMMGYLNNVEAGGATAFCKPFKEEIIQPRKGSITFWYSLGNEIHAYVISIF